MSDLTAARYEEMHNDAERRFLKLVAETFARTMPGERTLGYIDGMNAARDLVNAIQLRAAQSDEPGTDVAAQVLAVLSSDIEKNTPTA